MRLQMQPGTLAVAGLLILAAPMAFGSLIDIHSTGYGLSPGEVDPYYTLTVNALSNGTATYVAEGATIADLTIPGVPSVSWPLTGPWASDPNANWISPQPDVVAIAGTGSDTEYVYTTTFDLTGLAPNTADLQGYWTADNYIAQVQLNGKTIFSSNSCLSPIPQDGYFFQGLIPFNIDTGFQSGVNTLSFMVTNSNCDNAEPKTNPTGLLVDISGTAEPSSGELSAPSPEPGSLFSMALGLGCIFAFTIRSRKRQQRDS